MTPDRPIALPLSWRSYLRACFFTGMLLVFGVSAAFSSSGVLQVIGVALAAIGVAAGTDFLMYTRRWRLADGYLHVPRVWSPSRAMGVASGWRPDVDDVGRRDSMFAAATGDGLQRVTPNLMVARSDVKQWLYLISEIRGTTG